MFSLKQLLVCELQGGSSIWASNPGVSAGIPAGSPEGMGWGGLGWEPLLLSPHPSSSSSNPVVMVSSGQGARQKAGKESSELVPRLLLLPVHLSLTFPVRVGQPGRWAGGSVCLQVGQSCVAVLVCI